jgi:hypothetical protein
MSMDEVIDTVVASCDGNLRGAQVILKRLRQHRRPFPFWPVCRIGMSVLGSGMRMAWGMVSGYLPPG